MKEDCDEIKAMLHTLIAHKSISEKPAQLPQNSSSEVAEPTTPNSAKTT